MNDILKIEKINNLFIFIIVLYILVIFSPLFINQGPLLQCDQPMWTAVTDIVAKEEFKTQKWFQGIITDRTGAGLPLGEIYSISYMLPWIFSHFFSAAVSIKLTTIICVLIFVLSFYYFCRVYLPPTYAFFGSLMILTPMFDSMAYGVWYNQISLGFGLLFFVLLIKFIESNRRIYLFGAIIVLTLAIFSHPLGIVFSLTVWFTFLCIVIFKYKNYKLASFLLLIPFVSFLIASPQIFALLYQSHTNTVEESFSITLPQMTSFMEISRRMFALRVWEARAFSPINIFIMIFAILTIFITFSMGLYFLITKKKIELWLPIVSLILVTFVMISRIMIYLDIPQIKGIILSLTDDQLYQRFELISQIYLILLSLLGWYFLKKINLKIIKSENLLKITGGIVVVAYFFIIFSTPSKIFIERTQQLSTLNESRLYSQLQTFWKWCNENVKSNQERIFFQETWGELHWNTSRNPESYKTHLFSLTTLYTKINQFGGWVGASSIKFARAHEYRGGNYGSSPNDTSWYNFIFSKMKYLNCKYFVVCNEDLKLRFLGIPFLKLVTDYKDFAVFKNVKMIPAWAFSMDTGRKAEYKRYASNHFQIEVTGKKGELIHLSFAYHPRWKANTKNSQVPILNHDEFMRIRLPYDGKQTIVFKYTIDRVIPLVGMFGGILLTVFLVIIPTSFYRRLFGQGISA